MLLRTIFILAFLAVLGETLLYGAMALAQASLRQRALDATKLAFASGVRSAQAAVASDTIPAPTATCAYAGANGCAITITTSIATPSPLPSPSACPDTPCAVVLQRNTAVGEGRAAFAIASIARAANGAPLATRSGLVAFRTFGMAPYAAIAGSADGSIDRLASGGAGDDAGTASTLIGVELIPSGGGPAIPANVWQSSLENPPITAQSWDR